MAALRWLAVIPLSTVVTPCADQALDSASRFR